MMTLSAYLSFCVLVFTMVYSPGPMTMYMMANGMKMQYRRIWPVLMGANNAYLISMILFAVGLTQLLQHHLFVMKIVQVGGIIYLLYLAYQQWNKKIVSGSMGNGIEISKNSSLYTKGALIAFSNPKTIILFGLIFPQFMMEGGNHWAQMALLGATFLVLQFSSGCVYAYFGRRIKDKIEKPGSQHWINKFSAMVLLIVAGFLIVKFIS